MAAIKVSKSNAWTLWNNGRIAAANVYLHTQAPEYPPVIGSLAHARGYNALRLWFAWAYKYTLSEEDFIAIAADPAGWNSTALTRHGQATIAEVAAQVDRVLQACSQNGMGVIFTLDFFQGRGGRLWSEPGLHDSLVNFWKATAQRWQSNHAVIGYDILNEPSPSEGLSFAAIRAGTTENWPALAARVVAAIRQVDTATPIVVQGMYYGGPNGLGLFHAPDNSNSWLVPGTRIVYSFHMYHPGEITHQGVANWSYETLGMPYPAGAQWYWENFNGQLLGESSNGLFRDCNTAADLMAACKVALDFKARFNVPVFVGEFSMVDINFDTSSLPDSRISEVSPDDYHRQVTAISSTGSEVTVSVENISPHMFGWGQPDESIKRGADGFVIPYTRQKTAAQLNAIKQNNQDYGQYFTNEVLLTVSPIPGTPQAQAVASLNIVNQPVTIRRGGHQYVFNAAKPVVEILRQALATRDNDEKYFPPVATLSIKATAARAQAQPQSRVAYATDVLRMCQAKGLSWAWHAEDSNVGGFVGWRPSKAVAAVLRQAAMGRRLPG